MKKRLYILFTVLGIIIGGALAGTTALKTYLTEARAQASIPCGNATLPSDIVHEEVFMETGVDGRYLLKDGTLQGRIVLSYLSESEGHKDVFIPLAANPNSCKDERIKAKLIHAQKEALDTERSVCQEIESFLNGYVIENKPGFKMLDKAKAQIIFDTMCKPYGLTKAR